MSSDNVGQQPAFRRGVFGGICGQQCSIRNVEPKSTHVTRTLRSVTLKREVFSVQEMYLYRLQIPTVRFRTWHAIHEVGRSPNDQLWRLICSEVNMPFIVLVKVTGTVRMQPILNILFRLRVVSSKLPAGQSAPSSDAGPGGPQSNRANDKWALGPLTRCSQEDIVLSLGDQGKSTVRN
jgi:hypothetical protein